MARDDELLKLGSFGLMQDGSDMNVQGRSLAVSYFANVTFVGFDLIVILGGLLLAPDVAEQRF